MDVFKSQGREQDSTPAAVLALVLFTLPKGIVVGNVIKNMAVLGRD
jgi:hypothetical protein